MKKISCFVIFATLLLSSSLTWAEGMLTPDDSLWSSIQCDGISVDLMANHRTVAEPTLFVKNNDDVKRIKLEEGACFSGLKCVKYKGNSAVHFVESSCGNAYEIYWVVDIHSLQKYDLDYQTAHKLGIIDY